MWFGPFPLVAPTWTGSTQFLVFYALGGQRSVVGPESVSARACCREDRVAHPYSDGCAGFGGGNCAQCVFRFVQADGEVFRLQRSWSPTMLGNLPDDLLTDWSKSTEIVSPRSRAPVDSSASRRASRRCSVPMRSWPSREISRRLWASTFVVFGVNGMSPDGDC